ncbi:MAG: arginase family protein [Candidatus Nanoarchaeia archaeon]|nr:arginase family protein [Candidatus Nanoarchaeia archaeon]
MKVEGAVYTLEDSQAVITGLGRNENIIKSLNNLEGYDIDEDFDLFKSVRIHDAGDFNSIPSTNKNKFNIFIGKNHLSTYSFIKSFNSTDFGVVWFDAHSDLKEQHPGTFGVAMSNTTVLRRLLDFFPKENIVLFGIRSCSKEEANFIKNNNLKVAYDEEQLKEFLKTKSKWYLSIDIDILDPVFAPEVDYPEPDGYSHFEIIEVLKSIFESTDVFAVDMVEVMSKSPDLTSLHASKIIHKCLTFKFKD